MGRLTGLAAFEIAEDARSWSVYALLAGVVGASCSAVLIASQADLSQLKWPLILVPVVAVPLPVFVPRRAVRIAAVVVMALWCWLTGFSLGLFFVPCLLLMIGAARREEE